MRTLRIVNLLAKAALLLLLVHAALFPDLPQYQGKGIGWRLLLYPLPTVVVPIIWWIAHRRRAPLTRYPDLIDLCVVLPFLIDTAGNAVNLYDSVSWWDDAMHVVTWIPWVTAVGLATRYRPLERWNVAALTIGFGSTTHILWEFGEYVSFVNDNPGESATAYRDTIGDLLASLGGSVIGALLVTTVLWDIGRPVRVGPPAPPGPSPRTPSERTPASGGAVPRRPQ
jgi:hypothetical protein